MDAVLIEGPSQPDTDVCVNNRAVSKNAHYITAKGA